MLDDLDRTIERLLKEEINPEVSISFATPDNSFPPPSVNLPAVDVFLYDIRENRELRTNEFTISGINTDKPVRIPSPTRIECSYLITAWCPDSVPDKALEEHKLLGEVLEILLHSHTIPDKCFNGIQGNLKERTPSIRLVSLQPGHMEMAGPFWQALGGKPRASLNISVTVTSKEIPDEKPLSKRPTTRILKIREKKPDAKCYGDDEDNKLRKLIIKGKDDKK